MESPENLDPNNFEPGLVSVIIPCYQHGHLLPQALNSLLRQTYSNFEAIVINDGSTDNTREVALHYAAQHPDKIKYLEQERQGQARARRAATLRARGEFWLTLDADDILELQMLEKCVRRLQAEPDAALVASDVWLVDESGWRIIEYLKQDRLPCWPDVVIHNPFGGIAGILLRSAAVKKVGGLALEGRAGAEDWDLWIRLSRSRLQFTHLPEGLARYRQSSSSHSRQGLEVLLGIFDMLDNVKRDDPRLAQIPHCYPPISNELDRDLRNRAVFFCCGIAAASQASRENLLPILAYLVPPAIDVSLGAQSFCAGVSRQNLPQKSKSSVFSQSSLQVLADCLTTYLPSSVAQTLVSNIQSQYLSYYSQGRRKRWLMKFNYALLSLYYKAIKWR